MMKLWIVCLVAIAALFSSTSGQLLMCNRRNEEYACGSACQATCDTLNEPCPIVNIRCNDGCYCKPGYVRNCWNECIPEKSCPGKSCMRNLRYRKYPGISRF
ncbi:venom metalloprotease inhibitor-like [Lasioglossum baleicum]|uniref:venom metalloprotease inhibitor-like n=1 Tax=Lasioglossum baleicum TaxID=434251 RepID=UPI003FCD3E19